MNKIAATSEGWKGKQLQKQSAAIPECPQQVTEQMKQMTC